MALAITAMPAPAETPAITATGTLVAALDEGGLKGGDTVGDSVDVGDTEGDGVEGVKVMVGEGVIVLDGVVV